MDGIELLGVDRPHLIDWLADHIHHAAQRFVADRHLHRVAEAEGVHPADQAFGGLQGNGAHTAFADVLFYLANDIDGSGNVEALARNADSRINQGNLALWKLAVDGGAGYLDDFADWVTVVHTKPH